MTTPTWYPIFADRLEYYLGQQDRSQAWLAERLQVHPATVNRWLQGSTRPRTPEQVDRLCEILRVPPEERAAFFTAVGYSYVAINNEPASGTADRTAPAAEARVFPELPPRTYRLWVGRTEQLSRLLQILHDPAPPAILALVDLGGIGKTALAREVAERSRAAGIFDHLVWTSAKSEHFAGEQILQRGPGTYTFETLLDEIGRQCGQAEISRLPYTQKQAAIRTLLTQQQVLVILDNLETVREGDKLIYELAQILGRGKLLLTSRHQVRYEAVQTILLQGLPDEEGILFLREEGHLRGNEAVQGATFSQLLAIQRVAGGAPLAMKLLVGQMSRQPMEVVLRTLQGAAFQGQDYPFYRFVYHHSWGLLVLAARKVLVDLSVFPPVTGGGSTDVLAVSQVVSEVFWSAMGQLVVMSLVDKVGPAQQERFALHPLTQYFIRSDITREWELPDAEQGS